jgi:hypothetical protein
MMGFFMHACRGFEWGGIPGEDAYVDEVNEWNRWVI